MEATEVDLMKAVLDAAVEYVEQSIQDEHPSNDIGDLMAAVEAWKAHVGDA